MTEQALKADLGGLKLKGKIDRVDIKTGPAGDEPGATVMLLDYKTGRVSRQSSRG